MITVTLQPEPQEFEVLVRTPGSNWIAKSGLDPEKPVPAKTKIPAHWTKCLPALRDAYGGYCAYLCVYIPKVRGAPSVDHFVPKSRYLRQAYEWSNYRFVCAKMNSRKLNFEDVLDPFILEPESFELNLGDGSIAPHPRLNVVKRQEAVKTIKRLKLDDAECRFMRLELIQDYLLNKQNPQEGIPSGYLKLQAPFIWQEMKRQGWL